MGFKMRLMLVGGLVASLLLTGCSGLGQVPPAPQRLDLGAPAPTAPTNGQRQQTLVLPPLASASILQGMSVIWRVGDDGQPNSYATYEWSAAPESLVRERLMARLSKDFALLPTSVNSDDWVLRVNLMQFEQIYAPDGASNRGVISFQAVLLQGSQVLGQYRDTVSVAAQRNDAPAGAQALRLATDQVADKLVQWIKSVSPSRK
jgi:cholesterol transport system auxiliary component